MSTKKVVLCAKCGKVFKNGPSLSQHKKKYHPELVEIMRNRIKGEFSCPVESCHWTGVEKKRINQHLRAKHPEWKIEKKRELMYLCAICGENFSALTKLREHYEHVENKTTVSAIFPNKDEYQSWLSSLEEEGRIFISERIGRPKSKQYATFYKACRYSGNVRYRKKCPWYKKRYTSVRLGEICSAFLKAREWNTGQVEVVYCLDHTHETAPIQTPINQSSIISSPSVIVKSVASDHQFQRSFECMVGEEIVVENTVVDGSDGHLNVANDYRQLCIDQLEQLGDCIASIDDNLLLETVFVRLCEFRESISVVKFESV